MRISMPYSHHHEAPPTEAPAPDGPAPPQPEIRYVPVGRPSRLGGMVADLLESVARLAILAVVAVVLVVAMFVGGLALLGKAIELIPDPPAPTTTTTTAP